MIRVLVLALALLLSGAPTRAQVVEVNAHTLDTAPEIGGMPAVLTLPLSEDIEALAYQREGRIRETPVGVVSTWSGVLSGVPESQVVVTKLHGLLQATISSPQGLWHLSPDRYGRHQMRQLEFPNGVPCGTEEEERSLVASHGQSPIPAPNGTATTISVLGLYSRQARDGAGGVPQIELAIAHAVDLATEATHASNLADISFELAGVSLFTPYDEDDPTKSGLPFLFNHPMAQVLREAHQADLVAVVVENIPGLCGQATGYNNPPDRLLSFSINARFCLPGFVLTHEMGHNMGARHDPANASTRVPEGAPDYGFAHAWCEAVGPFGVRTVMHVGTLPDCGVGKINQFSNPDVLVDGVPSGLPFERDNSAVLRVTAPVVAAQRPGPCVPSDTELCLTGSRFKVTARWRLIDDSEGDGFAVPLTSGSGYFWFFHSTNVEVVVKVLNGCLANDRFWVFAAGLTNVEVTLTVTDMETGIQKTYVNPLSRPFRPIQDIMALPACL